MADWYFGKLVIINWQVELGAFLNPPITYNGKVRQLNGVPYECRTHPSLGGCHQCPGLACSDIDYRCYLERHPRVRDCQGRRVSPQSTGCRNGTSASARYSSAQRGAVGDRSQSKDVEQTPPTSTAKLPFDYYFLNHTSFLRADKQEEFRRLTGVPLNHYDIRVIVDSYYRGALDRIDRVEYILHSAYPNPEDKFLLKELANGEYVLMAKVFLKDREEPVLLQRYITLWESGSHLP